MHIFRYNSSCKIAPCLLSAAPTPALTITSRQSGIGLHTCTRFPGTVSRWHPIAVKISAELLGAMTHGRGPTR